MISNFLQLYQILQLLKQQARIALSILNQQNLEYNPRLQDSPKFKRKFFTGYRGIFNEPTIDTKKLTMATLLTRYLSPQMFSVKYYRIRSRIFPYFNCTWQNNCNENELGVIMFMLKARALTRVPEAVKIWGFLHKNRKISNNSVVN